MVDPQALATLIAAKVAADTSVTVATIALIGVLVGAIVGVLGTLLLYLLQSASRRKLDKQRSVLLTTMLDDNRFPNHWRKLSTLARVVGASEATTKRLLIGLGARSSENDDGFWGLLSHHPLSKTGE
jgi:hypothetical protein